MGAKGCVGRASWWEAWSSGEGKATNMQLSTASFALLLSCVVLVSAVDLPTACGEEQFVPVCTGLWTQGFLNGTHRDTCFQLGFGEDADLSSDKNYKLRVWMEVTKATTPTIPTLCTIIYSDPDANYTSVPECAGTASHELNVCYELLGLKSDYVYANVFCEADDCKGAEVFYTVRYDFLEAKEECFEGESPPSIDATESGSRLYQALAIGIVLLVFLCLGVLIGLRCLRLRRQVR